MFFWTFLGFHYSLKEHSESFVEDASNWVSVLALRALEHPIQRNAQLVGMLTCPYHVTCVAFLHKH